MTFGDKQADRNRVVDFIRGIAILMVVLVHYGQVFGDPYVTQLGQMGCQLFFVLSGYMCSYSLKKGSLKAFYCKRAFSIIPGYYTVLLCVVLCNILYVSKWGYYLSGNNIEPLSVVCNVLMIHGVLPFCQNNVFPGGWFIGAVAICYVLHPLIDRVFQKIKSKWTATVIVVIVFAGLTILLNYILEGDCFVKNNQFEYFLILNQLGCYVIGINLYYMELEKKRIEKKTTLLLAFLFLVALIFVFYSQILFRYVICPPLAGFFTCFLYLGIKDVQLKGKVVEMICKAGKESFCIFITHWIVVFNLDTKARNMLIRIGIENEGIHFLLIFVPAMIAVTMIAWAMKQIIVLEKKVLKL